MTDEELGHIAHAVHDRLKDDFTTARKWFWGAIGAAAASGVGWLVNWYLSHHFH